MSGCFGLLTILTCLLGLTLSQEATTLVSTESSSAANLIPEAVAQAQQDDVDDSMPPVEVDTMDDSVDDVDIPAVDPSQQPDDQTDAVDATDPPATTMEATTASEDTTAAGDNADPSTTTAAAAAVTTSMRERPTTPVYHHTNCSYQDHYCNPTAFDLLEKVEDKDVPSAMKCRELCIARSECSDFTFFNFRGIQTCFLLKGCTDKKPRCTVQASCISGRRDCADGKFCKALTQKPGEDIAWRCQSGINPYKEEIPSGTPCYTYCPSWRNKKGDVIVAKSVCGPDGSWSEPKSYPPGETVYPATLNKPDHKIMGCGCHPLKLEYDPSSEEGAEFYCENDLDLHNLPVKIGTDTRCHLFCDKMLISTIECKEGLWTGRPDLGFWCNRPRPSVKGWDGNSVLIKSTQKKRKSEQQLRPKRSALELLMH